MSKFGLRDEVLGFIIAAASEQDMSKVVLFGSRARESYSEKSDIDSVISGMNKERFIEQLEEHCPTLLAFDFIDLACDMSPSLQQRISEEGITLYEQV